MTDISSFSCQEVLARTAFGENRGGGIEGMTSVLNVIMNRANKPGWWGTTPSNVCLKPYQFSCWIPGTADYTATTTMPDTDPVMKEALDLASQAELGTLVDITNGSCYYIAASMNPWPHWCVGHTPVATIQGQLFFNDIM